MAPSGESVFDFGCRKLLRALEHRKRIEQARKISVHPDQLDQITLHTHREHGALIGQIHIGSLYEMKLCKNRF